MIRVFLLGIVFLVSCVAVPEKEMRPPLPNIPAPKRFDVETGLILDDGFGLVRDNCLNCHSPLLITQARGGRQSWVELIQRLRQEHGLREFEGGVEWRILDYLERNYGL